MNPLPPPALTRPRVQPPAWAPAPASPTYPTPASTARVGGFRVNGSIVEWEAFEAALQKINSLQIPNNLSHLRAVIDKALAKSSEIDIDLVINKIPYSKDQESFLVRCWESKIVTSSTRCIFYVESKITRIIDDFTRLLGLNS